DAAGLVNLAARHAMTKRLGDDKQPVRCRNTECGAQHIHVVTMPKALDLNLAKTVEPRIERAQSFLQAFGKGPANRHCFPDRFHRSCQYLLRAGKFFKSETWNLGYDIVD